MRFVPLLAEDVTLFAPFTMFSAAHAELWLRIVTAVWPAVALVVPLMALPAVRRRVLERLRTDRSQSLLASAALGYLLFSFVWGFDLGFPQDFDLMTSMGVVLVLFLGGTASEALGGDHADRATPLALLFVLAAVNVILSWRLVLGLL